MSIEDTFDVPFVAELALREKQIQQNYRPIIAVHKWFARRPGTLFRSLILSEFVAGPLRANFYKSHSLNGLSIADPFMGGGTPVLEANRLGCDVVGVDVNPMAHWIVTEETTDLDLNEYDKAAALTASWLNRKLGRHYQTMCIHCGSDGAQIKYAIWVKTTICSECGKDYDLFPGYLLAQNKRHTHNVVVCHSCGHLNEAADTAVLPACSNCSASLIMNGTASRSTATCPNCRFTSRYPTLKDGPPRHRMFAIEYYCEPCRRVRPGRLFKQPDHADIERYAAAGAELSGITPTFIPDDRIPAGDETNRLRNWGYRFYRDMFNARQLLGLETICRGISKHRSERIRHALYTNLSDLLRYQNMLCRYDTMALKSLDIFSVHGFPVGLIQCESNIIGINDHNGTAVGSGGWQNITSKYLKAKQYCVSPFEVLHEGTRKRIVPIKGEWIGQSGTDPDHLRGRKLVLDCMSSTELDLPEGSLDAVFTDPPYFGNVQYAELMDFCYTWLRKLLGDQHSHFEEESTRRPDELTGNVTMDRDLEHFTQGLSQVFQNMARALKPRAPLAFTYHHNSLDAYTPVAVAILDSGLACTATLPCPAEMGGSIHINGSGSSILDTVFVCRKEPIDTTHNEDALMSSVQTAITDDVGRLRNGGVVPTGGDIRCLAYGHMTRIAIALLAGAWTRSAATKDKLQTVSKTLAAFGDRRDIVDALKVNAKIIGGVSSRR